MTKALAKVGVRVKLAKNSHGDSGLIIQMDTEKFRRVTQRNAGAHRKSLFLDGNEVTSSGMNKVISMIQEIGMDETAKTLGVSRRTLYRRIKEYREKQGRI